MILSAVNICYDASHRPFASEGAVKIEELDSERPASKIIRAVIRYNGIDATSWESYSLHRCYCNSVAKIEDQHLEAFKSELNLEQLGIRGGDSVFIRKMDVGEEMEEEEQESTLRRSSRKRKERAVDESLDSQSQKSSSGVDSTPRKLKSTSNSSKRPFAVDKVSSNFENLTTNAARAARSISKLLGGDDWKNQSIGNLGSIQTKGEPNLRALWRLVKTSLEIPQLLRSDRSGLFNSDLVESLTRAYRQRVGSSMAEPGQRNFFDLGLYDYEQANELLRGKIEQDGSWERSNISHLDKSALSTPASRFPLSDSGLSGTNLNAARAICVLWNNEEWFNQAPLPGLASVSLKDEKINALLRQIADLTKVKPGEATPDGFPPIVLQSLRESIESNKEAFKSNSGSSQGGWSQKRCIEDTLALLKKRVATASSIPSSTTGQFSGASGSRGTGKRSVRPRLDDGK